MGYPKVDVEATRWPRSPLSKPSDLGGKCVILHSKQIFDPPFRPQGGLGWKKKVHQSTRTWILCQIWVLEIIRRCFQRAIGDSFQEIKRYSYATDLYKDFSPWLDEHFPCRNAIFDPLWNIGYYLLRICVTTVLAKFQWGGGVGGGLGFEKI